MLAAVLFPALLVLLPGSTIEGRVRTEGSGAPIAGAVVEMPALRRTARTDTNGAFQLRDIPAGTWRIQVRALGYTPHEATVGVGDNGVVRLEIELAPQPIELRGVKAEGRGRGLAQSSLDAGDASGPSPIRIDASVVSQAPSLVDTTLFRALQMLPAVQAASDYSSALYVRGGLPNQNLLLLDGAPLFNPYHLGGLFSAFDPDATEWVGLLPGGFPAGVGDRVASAVDVRTRAGDREQVRGGGSIGLLSSRASLNGPLPGSRGSYLVSLRRTYVDAATQLASAAGVIDHPFPYGFMDGHLKLTHDVGEGQISASVYLDEEGLGYRASDWSGPNVIRLADEIADFDWGSQVAALRFHHPIGASVNADLRAGISRFRGTFQFLRAPWDSAAQEFRVDPEQAYIDTRTLQQDLFAGADLVWRSGAHAVRSGLQLDAYHFDHDFYVQPGQFSDVIPSFRRREEPVTLAAYAEDEWAATDRLSVRGGLRLLAAGRRGTAWLPRAALRFQASPSLSLSVAAGRSAQVIRSLRSEESVWSSMMAYDVLSAVPEESGLTTAEDVVAGVEWERDGTSVRLDAYSRWTHDLPIAPLPGDIVEAPILAPDSVWTGESRARGLEVLARRAVGRSTWSLSYALTFAEMEAGGERFTPRYERRHILDASAALPLGATGLFSARVAWATGQPYTPILGATRGYGYDPLGRRLRQNATGYPTRSLLLGEHNGARLPSYFRLDVGVRKAFTREWWGREVTLTPYLSVLNALNTPNVLWGVPDSYSSAPLLEYTPQFPIVPTFGLEWTF